ELTREAVAGARSRGDAAALAYVLSLQHVAISSAHNVGERLAIAEEIVAIAQAAGDRVLEALGWHCCFVDLLELGDCDAMVRAFARFELLAGESHQPFLQWRTTVANGMRALLAGRYEEADALIRGARGARRGRFATINFMAQFGGLVVDRGEPERLQT